MKGKQRRPDIHEGLPESNPLPPRDVEWGKAWQAGKALMEEQHRPSVAYRLVLALDGGDSERLFQDFLAEPGARALIGDAPDLASVLADAESLAAMDEGSLGRTYLALTQKDDYSADGLTNVQHRVSTFFKVAPDPIRQWFFQRAAALRDVHRALLGYGCDAAGKAAMNVFIVAAHPSRAARFYTLVRSLNAPRDGYFRNVAYLHEAWKRGRESRIPLGARWEVLLPLQLDDVCRRLRVATAEEAHPGGILVGPKEGPWRPAGIG
jgi:ubiquinone biosynthesis protein Coq4